MSNATFGMALEAMKLGQKVRRPSWRDKDYLELDNAVIFLCHSDSYRTQVNMWRVKQEDILAEDWSII